MRSYWPTGGLWRHGDFLKLWSAETISQFGSTIDDIAFPLVAILVLDASAFEVAALATVLFLPFILFTLPAGVWVDRLPRRPILIVGDFGRAALYATVPIAYVADVLTLWQLYVVGFLVGVFQVFFDVAYQSYLPSLVDRDKIVEGNSKFEISRSAAQISGPGLGGILVEILTAPYAVLVDALSFVASGLFLLGIRKPEPKPEVDDRRRTQAEHVVRAQGGPPLRPRQPEPARPGRVHGDLQLLRKRRVLDRSRVRRARARTLSRRDRTRLLGRRRGLARSRPSRRRASRGGSGSARRRSSSRRCSRRPGSCGHWRRRATTRSRSSSRRSSSSGSRSSSTTSRR